MLYILKYPKFVVGLLAKGAGLKDEKKVYKCTHDYIMEILKGIKKKNDAFVYTVINGCFILIKCIYYILYRWCL